MNPPLPIAIFVFFLSQVDRKENETFHLTDNVENGLKGKMSKTEDSNWVFELSRMLSKVFG